MAEIITVPDLFLIRGKLFTSDGRNSVIKIHHQQGELDGACAMYSVAMCLLYEKIVTDLDTPGQGNGGRLLSNLYRNFGIIKSGFFFKKLYKIILEYKRKTWRVDYGEETPKECIRRICEEIDNGVAPIIGIGYVGCKDGHALLGVGYEKEREKIVRIYCLDPGAPTPISSIWNSYLDVRDLRKSSIYVNNNTKSEPQKVRLEDFIIIENLEEVPITEL